MSRDMRREGDLAGRFALALQAHQAGDLAAAERLYRDIRKTAPNHPDATHNLGILLAQTGRPSEAVPLLRRLVRIHPDFSAALVTLGVLLRDQGAVAEAVALLEKARAQRPHHPATLVNLGNTYAAAGRLDESADAHRAAIAAQPDLPQPRRALAEVLAALGRPAEVVPVLRDHLDRWPEDAEAWLRLGYTLNTLKREGEARTAFLRARALAPQAEEAQLAPLLAAIPTIPADAAEADAAVARYAERLDGLIERYRTAPPPVLAAAAAHVRAVDSFLLAYRERDITDLLAQQGDLIARLCRARYPTPLPSPPFSLASGAGRVRVGIVSKFLRSRHPVWKGLIGGWVTHLDRDRFACVGYHTDGTDPGDSAESAAARGAFDRVIGPLSGIEAWAAAIAADRPDILIYPDGPMDSVSQQLSALRLAPVQCATWGHPASTGLPTIDVFLGADALEPPDGERHYRERLLRVAGLGTCYEPDSAGVAPHPRGWFGEPDGVTLYGCAQMLQKYLPEHDSVFPRIARDAGPCRFVFFEDSQPAVTAAFRDRLSVAFRAAGLEAADWCRFLPRTGVTDYYATLGALDVYLDSIGFSGFNTAMEALSYDVPIVTCEGRFLRGRLASGILRHIGVTDGIAADADAYVSIAIALGRQPERRADMAARLQRAKPRAWRDKAAVASLADHLWSLARPTGG